MHLSSPAFISRIRVIILLGHHSCQLRIMLMPVHATQFGFPFTINCPFSTETHLQSARRCCTCLSLRPCLLRLPVSGYINKVSQQSRHCGFSSSLHVPIFSTSLRIPFVHQGCLMIQVADLVRQKPQRALQLRPYRSFQHHAFIFS